MHMGAMGERGRTLARELALPHYCLPGQHSARAGTGVQNQNPATPTEPMPRSQKDVLLPVPTAQRTRRERHVSAHLCIRGHGVGEHECGRTSAHELALALDRRLGPCMVLNPDD